jgi:hypothetical protein
MRDDSDGGAGTFKLATAAQARNVHRVASIMNEALVKSGADGDDFSLQEIVAGIAYVYATYGKAIRCSGCPELTLDVLLAQVRALWTE